MHTHSSLLTRSLKMHSLHFLLLTLLFLNYFHSTLPKKTLSLSFPLTSAPLHHPDDHLLSSQLLENKTAASLPPFIYNSKSPFKYSMALIVSLPIGTPPQAQQLVIDTGSQLSWIQCHRKSPPTTSFDPSRSSSFSLLPCTHPICKPRIPDFTLPTTCDNNRLCHYSYFYADGTLAEGNLVRERFTFPASRSTPPLTLGCAVESSEAQGILGMNLGRLSFVSQAKVPRFSYCVPSSVMTQTRDNNNNYSKINPTGTFYLGRNPHSALFQYIDLLSFPQSQNKPNFDPLAYTVGLTAVKIGGRKLNIPVAAFRPDAGGSGQTMIDSGTQYTFLVEAAYNKVREEVVRRVGAKLKRDYTYGGALDMCFDGNALEIARLIGDMAFEFDKGVEITVNKERILDEVGGGVHCVAIGRSESLGIASNIVGNYHQQNHWVEFDLVNRRVGFGVADCTNSL